MARTIEELQAAMHEYFPSLVEWVTQDINIRKAVENAFEALEAGSLSWARLNQIMHLCSQAGMSEGFYQYYFLELPDKHPYPVEMVFSSDKSFEPPDGVNEIKTMIQFNWGIRRFIYDAMLYWGNFKQAYRDLRSKSLDDITEEFSKRRVKENRLITRGKIVTPIPIAHDNRHLISEMACKTYEMNEHVSEATHVQAALQAFRELREMNVDVTPLILRERARIIAEGNGQVGLFDLLFEDPTDRLETESDVLALYSGQWERFKESRAAALINTRIYLSVCSDLDVYVATSMRTRDDFREMARTCEQIFTDDRLTKYNIRYFDPTLSAAQYHEDKGIIECLMVKTAKILLYFAQHKESLGKVSEYAMALSLGKPVIILCPADTRGTEIYRFYQDQHPLLRLVAFETGIVNGAIVTQDVDQVTALIERMLSNRMEYDLIQKEGHEGYYLLKERLSGSTVRVISDDKMLTETFWNNYHDVY